MSARRGKITIFTVIELRRTKGGARSKKLERNETKRNEKEKGGGNSGEFELAWKGVYKITRPFQMAAGGSLFVKGGKGT